MIIRIQRLYIIDFFTVITILTVGMSVLFGLLGLVERMAEFSKYDPSLSLLIQYAIASIPRYVLYFLPMGALLSSLFVFSLAVKRREIVAIKTSGGRMRRLLAPFVIIGVLLTLFGFIMGEFIVPHTAVKVRSIADEITGKGKNSTLFKDGRLYMRGRDGSVIKIDLHMPAQNISKGVTIFKFVSGELAERVDAETAVWENNAWKLNNVTIYSIRDGVPAAKDELVYTGIESPKIFKDDVIKVEEMTIMELIRYRNRLTESGFRNSKLSVDVSSRLAYPIINMFMVLLGISLAVGGEQKGLEKLFRIKMQGAHTNTGVLSAGLGLIISVAYWLTYTFSLSLGYSGTIPPIIAPWVVPVLFSFVSLWLYRSIPE